jgi:hypothetical protein
LNKQPQSRNDLNAAVPKFCFELEMDRRTPEGRVRTAQEFLAHFFPHDAKSCTDRIFRHLPREVRGPILTTWSIRGKRTALRDDDDRVAAVVHDALAAGDIDGTMFEQALAPNVIMRWIDLADWWTFWRGGKITKYTILRALESGYEAALFDADWFLGALKSHGGKLQGTDVLAEGLSKDDLSEWVRNIHEAGDGSPKGIVGALGWDKIVAKTADEVLIAVLDAMASKVALVGPKDDSAPKAANGGGVGGGSGEQVLDADAAATLFKDDELLPVGGEWDESGEGGGTRPTGSPPRPPSASPPGK